MLLTIFLVVLAVLALWLWRWWALWIGVGLVVATAIANFDLTTLIVTVVGAVIVYYGLIREKG